MNSLAEREEIFLEKLYNSLEDIKGVSLGKKITKKYKVFDRFNDIKRR